MRHPFRISSLRDASVKWKLLVVSILTTLIALAVTGAALLTYETLTYRADVLRGAATLSKIAAANSTAALVFNDKKALNETLSALGAEPHVIQACVYSRAGELFGAYVKKSSVERCPPSAGEDGRSYRFETRFFALSSPILLESERVGTIRIVYDLKGYYGRLRLYLITFVSASILGSAIAFFMSARFQRLISGPILDFAKVVRLVSERKDLSIRAKKETHDEVALVVDAFNQMLTQLENRYRELQEAIRAREDFLSIAAHELRTPLTPLKLQLQSLKQIAAQSGFAGFPRERLVKILESSDREINRFTKLIEDMLDVTRLGKGPPQLTLENVSLSELVRTVVARFQPQIDAAKSSVEIRADSNVVGHWDRSRLDQIVTNLLTNSLKYGQAKPIKVSVSAERGMARLVVQDKGIGIARDFQEKVFGKFERGVSSRYFGGFGLGLYITQQIIEAHHGKVSVESAPGEGATFTVELPMQGP